jgi:hypothetical protein
MIVRLKHAKVLATSDFEYSPKLTLLIEGVFKGTKHEFTHTFSPNSRESRLLLTTDMQTINRLFNGGSYLFVNGVMRDYRSSTYKDYHHSDDAIDALVERLGYSVVEPMKPGKVSMVQNVRNRLNGAFLGGAWDEFDLEIPKMGEGGKFTNKLVAAWSPFKKNVIINVDTLRLICSNGMVGEASALTYQVPVVSDWKTSLDIASRQLKPRVNDEMLRGFEALVDQRASIYDVNRARDLLSRRHIGGKSEGGAEMAQMQDLLRLTDVERHLRHYYSSDELKVNQNPAHLTRYDVFNILTEASSHIGNDAYNDRAITGYLNEFVFGKEKASTVTTGIIKVSEESDHNRAFFTSYNAKLKG